MKTALRVQGTAHPPRVEKVLSRQPPPPSFSLFRPFSVCMTTCVVFVCACTRVNCNEDTNRQRNAAVPSKSSSGRETLFSSLGTRQDLPSPVKLKTLPQTPTARRQQSETTIDPLSQVCCSTCAHANGVTLHFLLYWLEQMDTHSSLHSTFLGARKLRTLSRTSSASRLAMSSVVSLGAVRPAHLRMRPSLDASRQAKAGQKTHRQTRRRSEGASFPPPPDRLMCHCISFSALDW
jgi:hypothetical protein